MEVTEADNVDGDDGKVIPLAITDYLARLYRASGVACSADAQDNLRIRHLHVPRLIGKSQPNLLPTLHADLSYLIQNPLLERNFRHTYDRFLLNSTSFRDVIAIS